MKNTKVFLFFFFLAFAICFAMPAVFLVEPLLEIPEKNAILESGVEIAAVVVPGSERSNIEVNGVAYYSVEYKFVVDNAEHFGKTTQRYTYNEASRLNILTIKYNPDTFKSVQVDYDFKTDAEVKTSFIILAICGVFDLIFWIIEIVLIIQFIKLGIVALKGKSYTAKFIAIKPGVIYNGTPMYSIAYTWMNDSGETLEGKSGDDYTLNEAHAFELAQEFKIMAYGNISKIASKPSKMIFKQAKEENVSVENYYVCPYCNSMLPTSTTKCTSCGAPRKADSMPVNN